MSENNIPNQVLEKIKNIRPTPRWQFLLRDYSVWILGAVSLALGSLSFSVVLFMLANNDWDIYSEISNSFFKFLLITLPYFWLVFFPQYPLHINAVFFLVPYMIGLLIWPIMHGYIKN